MGFIKNLVIMIALLILLYNIGFDGLLNSFASSGARFIKSILDSIVPGM